MATNTASASIPKKTTEDFTFVKEINSGSYSTVYLAVEKATNREFAIKAVDKALIKRLKKTAEVFREKEILARLNDCDFAVKLYCTFQNETTLYFGLSYCPNGDLLQYIDDPGHFEENTTRFYAAELVEALEYLHNRNIVHRDLKPENILLTDDMHIQLTDFGSAIIIDKSEVTPTDNKNGPDDEKQVTERRNSFVGTAQFVAPEIIQRGPVHTGSDLWSLGCVIYQMATGNHLFRGYHQYDILNAVARVSYKLPDDFPEVIGDLIRKLVCLNPADRLGSDETGGMNKLKAHPFFSEDSYDLKWGHLLSQPSPLQAKAKFSSKLTNSNGDIEKS